MNGALSVQGKVSSYRLCCSGYWAHLMLSNSLCSAVVRGSVASLNYYSNGGEHTWQRPVETQYFLRLRPKAVLVEKLNIKIAFCVQWLWHGSQIHEQWTPLEKYFNPHYSCFVVCLAWLNVKGPMKQLSDHTLMSPFCVMLHETVCWGGTWHQEGRDLGVKVCGQRNKWHWNHGGESSVLMYSFSCLQRIGVF